MNSKRCHNLTAASCGVLNPTANKLCMEKDSEFQNISTLCNILNRFANDIRYPHKYEVNASDVNFSIDAVEKIRNIKPFIDLKNKN
jgi:hypothetical protein